MVSELQRKAFCVMVLLGVLTATTAADAVDSTPPTVSSLLPSQGAFVHAMPSPIQVTFSEPVTGMTANALKVAGSAATHVTADDQNRVFEFSGYDVPSLAGSVKVTLESELIKDLAGNSLVERTWYYLIVNFKPAPANAFPVTVLFQLDIDGDGLPDATTDSDGDGLPDNWERGPRLNEIPTETLDKDGNLVDRLVNFSAPTAIGPGTPPTFVLSRLLVSTDADKWDTDGDGLSDFIEVFGLKFIDDNRNGVLDYQPDLSYPRTGSPHVYRVTTTSEWMDLNQDGLPSIGEFALPNTDFLMQYQYMFVNVADGTIEPDESAPNSGYVPVHRDRDFDGFVFTDPTQDDTDGDGIKDGNDPDPLINPATFGITVSADVSFTRPGLNPEDKDMDNDGFGNGSDFGNDAEGIIDYPQGISELVRLFRPDLLPTGAIPEYLIEDLIGADWNGDGLYRITDWKGIKSHKTGRLELNAAELDRVPELKGRVQELFYVGTHELFAQHGAWPSTAEYAYAQRGIPLGFQTLLLPAKTSDFFPDVRVWTILYAWRVPGFDVDGNGHTGDEEEAHVFAKKGIEGLDGSIVATFPPSCGNIGGLYGITQLILGLGLLRIVVSRRAR